MVNYWSAVRRAKWEASTKSLSMRVDPDLRIEIDTYAKRAKLSRAEAARTLITIGLETVKADSK